MFHLFRRFPLRHYLIVILFLALAFPSLALAKQDIRYITFSGTRLLEKPSAFSKTLAKLNAGASVMVVKAQGAYLYVTTGEKPGWIAVRAVQAAKPKIGSSAKASTDASAEEVAAATKGFNSDVEAKYSKDNPALDFKQLDRLIDRTFMADPLEQLKDFRQKGKLGEFSGGANE
jgi:hypothetical protein